MIVVLPHSGSNRARVAFANERIKKPTIATLLVPNLSPRRPPKICPAIAPNTTIPPMTPLYFA